jgi:pimeloyl-[acyl-carrier protein] methyl ester esterase
MKLYIEQRGSGKELVLLHGWGLHGGLWGPFAEELATRFRITLVDLPGHGHSDTAGTISVDGMAMAVADCLRATITEPATVLGWSMGALVALQLAARFGTRFNRLVWIAGTPSFVARDTWPVGMVPATLEKFAEGLAQDYHGTLKRFVSLNLGQCADRQALKFMQQSLFDRGTPTHETLDQGLAILRHSDMRETLAASRLPLLLVQGTHDRLVHPGTVDAIRQLRSAASIVVPGAGHAPFLGATELVTQAIREFVS